MKRMRRRLTVIFTALAGAILAIVLGVSCHFAVSQISGEVGRGFSNVMTDAIGFVGDTAYGGSTAKYTEPQPYYVSITNVDGEELVRPAAGDDAARVEVLVRVNETSEELGRPSWVQASYSYDMDTGAIISSDEAAPESVWVSSVVSVMDTEGFFQVESAEGDKYIATSFVFSIGSEVMSSFAGPFGDVSKSSHSGDTPYHIYNDGTTNIQLPEGGFAPQEYTIELAMPLAGVYRQMALTVALYAGFFVLGVGLLLLASWFLSGIAVRPAIQSMERQSAFIAAAGHELRTPIAVAQSCLSASMKVPDQGEAEGYRQSALDEMGRMGRLVNDLMLLTRGDSGRWEVALEPVDLDTVLIEAKEQLEPLAKEQGKQLDLELPEKTLPPVQGDAARLRQMLAILVDNALRYSPEGGSVAIRADEKRGRVRLAVEDHGPGIPDDEKEKVFDRFYRAQQSRSDENHFGLGLAIAKELAALHGGTLEVLDTPGGGATFRLCLPAGKP